MENKWYDKNDDNCKVCVKACVDVCLDEKSLNIEICQECRENEYDN